MARNCAITIGINQYSYLKSLNYAMQDANAMHSFFSTEMGFDKLYHFTDESLPILQDYGPHQDSRPISSTLRRFLRTRFNEPFLCDGDNLWFFFAGHGVRYEGRDYLMPIDADLEDINNSAIPIHYISERLRRSGADNIILLIDACRSYEGRRDGIGIGKEKQQGVVTLFSCSPEESSYEIQELEQGAYTHTLLDSLRLQGEGNCATVERLYQRLRYYVPLLTQQYKKTIQTPYGVIEPLSKSHLVLLPKQATLGDVETLKKDALTAEVSGRLKIAKRLWVRVLAVSPADLEAIEGIERLVQDSSSQKRTVESSITERGAGLTIETPNSLRQRKGTKYQQLTPTLLSSLKTRLNTTFRSHQVTAKIVVGIVCVLLSLIVFIPQRLGEDNTDQATETSEGIEKTGENPVSISPVFFCRYEAEEYIATMFVKTAGGDFPVISFSDYTDKNERRELCYSVSAKFQQASEENRLDYLTTGRANGEPVICTRSEVNDRCEDVLITLPSTHSPTKVLESLLDIQRGVSGRTIVL